jgi:hypothetical protein
MQFVLAFGVVSMLADFIYEGARAIVGPYLATLGASAAPVGAVTGFGEAAALGFATFGVLSYHLQVRHVLPRALIPVTYSVAMAAAALAALGSGRLYDRIGLRGLVIALPLAAVVPVLSFSTDSTWVWIGAGVWGAATGSGELGQGP